MSVSFELNGYGVAPEVDPQTPLLWTLRDHLDMTGTKFGCGMGQCGACTVHVDGQPARACITPVSAVAGRSVTTIEGLAAGRAGAAVAAAGRAVRQAWETLAVVQCGYCQSGQIMSAAALLAATPDPDDHAIDRAMSGNICRCATYVRIRAAIKSAARELA